MITSSTSWLSYSYYSTLNWKGEYWERCPKRATEAGEREGTEWRGREGEHGTQSCAGWGQAQQKTFQLLFSEAAEHQVCLHYEVRDHTERLVSTSLCSTVYSSCRRLTFSLPTSRTQEWEGQGWNRLHCCDQAFHVLLSGPEQGEHGCWSTLKYSFISSMVMEIEETEYSPSFWISYFLSIAKHYSVRFYFQFYKCTLFRKRRGLKVASTK